MKRTIIFSAFMAILLSAVYTSAQTSGLRLSYSEAVNQSGVPTGTVNCFVDGEHVMQVFEAVIPATTEAACFASMDFSAARPVGPDRASVTYDPATSSYTLKWTGVKDRRDSCRVLLVGQSIGVSDLAMWQANYGTGGFAEYQIPHDDASRVGKSSCALMLFAVSGKSVKVTHPGQDDELVEVGFPAAANSNFRLLETSFPARTDAECVANQDFSTATPVGSDRATIGYFPSSGLWHLNNTYRGRTTVECHALLADGDNTVNAADYTTWRSRFGSSLFAEGEGSLMEDARQPGTRTGDTVT